MFSFKQHHKKIENHPERVPNIKLFLNLYSWVGIEYLRNVNKRNCALLKEINLEIALIVSYVEVEVMTSQFEVGE